MKRKLESRPEIVRKVEETCARLDITEKDLLVTAGVAANFLSKARAGHGGGLRADGSWRKILAALQKLEKRASLAAACGAPSNAAEPSSVASITCPSCGTPVSIPGAPSTARGSELVQLIQSATSVDDLEKLNRTVMEGVARGEVDPNVGRVLSDLVNRSQQLLKLRLEQERRGAADAPVRVVIRYENRWQPKIKAPFQSLNTDSEPGTPITNPTPSI